MFRKHEHAGETVPFEWVFEIGQDSMIRELSEKLSGCFYRASDLCNNDKKRVYDYLMMKHRLLRNCDTQLLWNRVHDVPKSLAVKSNTRV